MNKQKLLGKIALAVTVVSGVFFLYFAYGTIAHLIVGQTVAAEAEASYQAYEAYMAYIANAPATETNEAIDVPEDSETPEVPETPEAPEVPLPPNELIRQQTGNNDVIGYIYIPGTSISYAVLQGTDNDFYLTHDMYGQPSAYGALFLDYTNQRSFTDPNSIIYGHNMRNGTKFHNLRYFMDQPYFENYRYIHLFTDDGLLVYEIFAAFVTHISFYYIQTQFADGEFESLAQALVQKSHHSTDIYITPDDRILILSTCTNIERDTRYVVAARLQIS